MLGHLTPKGGILGGGFRGQKVRNLGTLLNGWTGCHQIVHMSADSPGNRHKLNKLGRRDPLGAFCGFHGDKNSNL